MSPWPGRLALGSLLLTCYPVAALTAQGLDEVTACRAEKAELATRMAAVFDDFDAARVPLPLDLLVALDGRIRALLRDRPSYRPCASDVELIYDPRWQRMGVGPGYWNDLRYTGQLLVEAHRRDPESSQRAYTLYSMVFGETSEDGLGVMPDISAAFAYEREFADGPFIRDVYRTIADFHKDLFMVLRDQLTDYKFECFARYIGREPWPAQKARARQVALDYYGLVLLIDSGDETARRLRDETAREIVKVWSFCAD